MLKTLCASLQVASETGLPANMLGLGVVAEVNKADKASTPSQSPAVKDKDKEGWTKQWMRWGVEQSQRKRELQVQLAVVAGRRRGAIAVGFGSEAATEVGTAVAVVVAAETPLSSDCCERSLRV